MTIPIRLIHKKVLLGIALVIPLSYMATCSYKSHVGNNAFEVIKTGDTEASVTKIFGNPSFREKQGVLYSRYATQACVSPCVERIWFENRFSILDEAWSIELGDDKRVIKKSYWLSP